jgi:hypothetical protein
MRSGQVFTFDDTHQNFADALGVASFGDIRLQETADNAYGAVVKQLRSYWISKAG